MEILDACGFYPVIGVKVLIQKALITISDGKLDMHDLVQEMGHYIIRGNHLNNPEKHNRVWKTAEINNMCFENATMVNENIEAIKYDGGSSRFPELVSNMKKLRLLYVSNFRGDRKVIYAPTFLSDELRYLHLSGYLASPLPENFNPAKLVFLKLCYSLQKELWKRYKFLPCLKELHLHHALGLVATPDFGGLPCLQKLSLRHCWSLEHIDPSLGKHTSLVSVSVYDCEKLMAFPIIVGLDKLKLLEIILCKKLLEFPEIKENMDSLVNLSLETNGIQVLPSSIGKYCTNLISLNLKNSSNLKRIEGDFHGLKHLQKFYWCSEWGNLKLPNDLFDEKCRLEELSLPRMRLGHYPNFPRLLKKLDLSWCNLKDGELPSGIGELFNLQELDLSHNNFSRLPFKLSQLTRIKLLSLRSCQRLVELPELPSGIAILEASFCSSLEAIGDSYKSCKWLYEVSIEDSKSVIAGGRLLQSLLQGNAIEKHSMRLQHDGLEIPKGFIPSLLKGTRYTLQLPENWCYDFCGFLMCAALWRVMHHSPKITMKHAKDGSMGTDSQPGLWKTGVCDDRCTWVGYVSFSSLRQTKWWDQISTTLWVSFLIEFNESYYDDKMYYPDKTNQDTEETSSSLDYGGFGVGLVPNRSEGGSMETRDSCEFYDEEYDYKCNFWIQHDSSSDLRIKFNSLQKD